MSFPAAPPPPVHPAPGSRLRVLRTRVAWCLFVSAGLACPCLVLLAGVLFERTVLGRFMLDHLALVLVGSALYALSALVVGLWLLPDSDRNRSAGNGSNTYRTMGAMMPPMMLGMLPF